jgi:DNA invertase Pin-like site-specific DNA recombinase
MKRVALYLRVSTIDQHPENQALALRQAAAQRGWEIVESYEDRISGAKAKRPALDRMLSDARHGRFDVIMVAAFDRLARSVRHLLEVVDEMSRCGVEFVSLREAVDTGGPMGRAVVTILGAVAELERSLLIERVKLGMHRARLEGRRIGRKPLEVDRQEILEDRYRMGYSLKKIAQIHGISKTSVLRVLKAAGTEGFTQLQLQSNENTSKESAA